MASEPCTFSYVAWHMRVHAEKVSAPVRVMMMSEKCMQPMRPRPPLQGQLRSLYGLPGQSSCPIHPHPAVLLQICTPILYSQPGPSDAIVSHANSIWCQD